MIINSNKFPQQENFIGIFRKHFSPRYSVVLLSYEFIWVEGMFKVATKNRDLKNTDSPNNIRPIGRSIWKYKKKKSNFENGTEPNERTERVGSSAWKKTALHFFFLLEQWMILEIDEMSFLLPLLCSWLLGKWRLEFGSAEFVWTPTV